MTKLTQIATFVVRKLWTLFAIVVVVFAILMSLVRYSLPYINDQKHHIENYAKNTYGVDLYISEIDAQWNSSGPQLVLKSVELPQSNSSPIDLSISNINVEIDFWDSLIARQFISRSFNLDGLKLTVDVPRIESSERSFPILEALEGLFLEQLKLFSVTDSSLSIVTENTNEHIDIEYLLWQNKGNRHQGQGRLQISEIANNSAFFVLDLYTQDEAINGTLYANAKAMDISPWLNELGSFKTPMTEGRGNFELWGTIEDHRLVRVNGAFQPSQFIWQDTQDGSETGVVVQSGEFVLQPNNSAWVFNLQDLQLDLLGTSILTDLSGSYSYKDGLTVNVDTPMQIGALVEFASVLYSPENSQINQFNPVSMLDELSVVFNGNQTSAFAKFSGLGWDAQAKVPGISGLSSTVAYRDNTLAINVFSEQANLVSTNLFDEDIPLQALNIPVLIQFESSTFELIVDGFSVELPDFTLNAGARYDHSNGLLSAHASIDDFATAKIAQYLPTKAMGQGVVSFLKRAFNENGKVTQTSALWQGKLKGFPFSENQGVFQANVGIEQTDFIFSPEWPELEKVDIELDFVNNDLYLSANKAMLMGVELLDVQGHIPNLLTASDINLNAAANTTGAKLKELMLNSSLSANLGRLLDTQVIVERELSANINLDVPFNRPDKSTANGRVILNGNTINLEALQLSLNDVQGELLFTNEHVTFKDTQANLWGQTISFDYNSQQTENGYVIDALVDASWDTSEFVSLIGPRFSEFASGSMDWNAVINATLQGNEFEYSASVYSSLLNSQSLLPEPFNTVNGEKLPLFIKSKGNNQASNISVSLAQSVQFDGIFPHKEKQFSRAHLALGDTEYMGLGLGFSVSANLPAIELLPWYNLVSTIVASSDASKDQIFPTPARLFVETDELIVAGQSFIEVDLIAKRQADRWLVDINSDESKASVTLFNDLLTRGIDIDIDFLRLESLTQTQAVDSLDIDPQSLPPINLYCRQCSLLGNELGEVVLETTPNDDGMSIDNLRFNGTHGGLRADGQWYRRSGDHFTLLSGSLDSSDFGGLLKDFQFDSGIRDSEADIDFTLTWQKSPLDFSFANLNGELDWELTDGYLTELSDKGSRIFTLLSLESLIRKLSLDFRDVFAKGFFYNQMEGSVQITQGKADTRDTAIDGGAGEMTIYGYTDLVSRELNYNVGFTPKVTGNLPVLVYFMVNPPTALAALALDQVLTSTKVISNVNYSITGTLDKPILLETGRQSTDVALPARNNIQDTDQSFIPPTIEDALEVEVNDS